jgi:hypothetical protein
VVSRIGVEGLITVEAPRLVSLTLHSEQAHFHLLCSERHLLRDWRPRRDLIRRKPSGPAPLPGTFAKEPHATRFLTFSRLSEGLRQVITAFSSSPATKSRRASFRLSSFVRSCRAPVTSQATRLLLMRKESRYWIAGFFFWIAACPKSN